MYREMPDWSTVLLLFILSVIYQKEIKGMLMKTTKMTKLNNKEKGEVLVKQWHQPALARY